MDAMNETPESGAHDRRPGKQNQIDDYIPHEELFQNFNAHNESP
jgi:hypothetical protein